MKKILLFIFVCTARAVFGQSISDIQGEAELSPFNGMEVNTTGIVTGIHDVGYFIQDGEGAWSGVYVYEPGHIAEIGQEVEITGTVEEYFDLTEIKDITSFSVVSTDNPLPAPSMLSTMEMNDEAYEGVLVQLSSAVCTNPDLGFGEYELNDGSGSCMGDDLLFAYGFEAGIPYNVTGPVYYSFSNYKILPRSTEDVIIDVPLYFTSLPDETSLSTTGMDINWSTNIASNSTIEYGTDPENLDQTITLEDMVVDHVLSLEGLTPGEVYYLKIYSQEGENSTNEHLKTVATVSESSGEIKVYFNHVVDVEVATEEEAVWTEHIADTIIYYMDQAEETLDLAVYDWLECPESIPNKLNEKYDQGVTIRIISDDEPPNEVLDLLNENIPVLRGNDVGIMHDKFIIIDHASTENSWLLSGSTNFTYANLGWDYNNLICIQDQSLARGYLVEFNEMWGSDGDLPDEENAKFGNEKSDNTPHKFIVDGIETELYFSPTDQTAGKIGEKLNAAEYEMAFAVLVFTENALGTAVANAHDNGLNVSGIIDYVEFNGSEYNYLLNAGVNVMDYQNEDGTQWPDGPTLHHKYAILDYEEGHENPVLITGSHNWSASANSIHDENTLIFHDHRLANLYYQEFSARMQNMQDPEVNNISQLNGIDVLVYPNPAVDVLLIRAENQESIEVFDITGKLVLSQRSSGNLQRIDISGLDEGIYTLRIKNNDKFSTHKIMKATY